jgi:hypothetical protein
MRCQRCRYSFAGLNPGATRACPECGAQIDWGNWPPPPRRRVPVAALILLAAPYAAVLVTCVCAPRNPYDGMISDGAINLLMLLWLASPLPTVAGLLRLIDRHGAQSGRNMAAAIFLGTLATAALVPAFAFLVLVLLG